MLPVREDNSVNNAIFFRLFDLNVASVGHSITYRSSNNLSYKHFVSELLGSHLHYNKVPTELFATSWWNMLEPYNANCWDIVCVIVGVNMRYSHTKKSKCNFMISSVIDFVYLMTHNDL